MSALLTASISFGSSAILIRYAIEASALSLTFFRLSISAIVIIIWCLLTKRLVNIAREHLLLLALSGVVLSFHFLSFIFAVQETTVANATFLVSTSPVMLTVMAPIMIKERTLLREGFGVLVAMTGVLLVANLENGFRAFGIGELSALLAAFLMALYTLIGRGVRSKGMTTASYTLYVYSFASVTSLIVTIFFGGNPVKPYDAQNIAAILGLALVPTLLGHSLYNYSLGSIRTVTANLIRLVEPILASLFAVPLFGEIPSILQIAGYGLILIAVLIVIVG